MAYTQDLTVPGFGNPLDIFTGLVNAGTNVAGLVTGYEGAKHSLELQKQALAQNDRLARQQLNLLERQNKAQNNLASENIAWQKDIANMNFGLQQNQFDYQKRLNQLQMEREDNAIQRQVADLQAAGFSPLMATGGSPSSPLSSGSAPQYDVSGVSSAQNSYLQLAQQYAQLKQDTMSSHRSAKVQAYNQMANTKQASSFALSSLIRGINQDLNAQYWNVQNYRLNAEHQAKQNELLQEQIETAKESRNWNIKNGWRNENLSNYIVQALSSWLPPTEAGKKLEEITSAILSGNNDTVVKTVNEIKNVAPEVKKAIIQASNDIQEAKTEIFNKTKFNRDLQSQKLINELYNPISKSRYKALEQYWEDHKESFRHDKYKNAFYINKSQFANLNLAELWKFYYNPYKYIHEF